jgi:tetratricopeptide (TPR) repeat protein
LQRNEEDRDKKDFPIVSFIVVMVSLLFFMSGPFISSYIPERLQILNTEVSPSFSSTFFVMKGVLAKNPIFGVGPNRFGEMWSMYKPLALNATQFWDVSFDSGSGLIPTLVSTAGVLAAIAWLVFLLLFLFIGLKSVFSSIKNGENWEIVALFVLSLYLFVASFFYSTGVVVLLLSLAFAGMFVGLVASKTEKELLISFLNDHRKSFFSILTLIVVLIFSVGISFRYIERFVSIAYFEKAVLSQTEDDAEKFINKALALYSNDLYLRTYAQVYLIKLNTLANKGSGLSEAEKADLQTNLNQAINGAGLAVSYDPLNFLNSQLLGSLYQTVGVFGIKDAYSKALSAFREASRLNPLNPRLKLAMASVSFADKKTKEAKNYAKEALDLKGDYIDALITLSQIAKSEGNNSEALSYAQDALSLSPKDKNLIQYVNSLSGSISSSGATSTDKNKK